MTMCFWYTNLLNGNLCFGFIIKREWEKESLLFDVSKQFVFMEKQKKIHIYFKNIHYSSTYLQNEQTTSLRYYLLFFDKHKWKSLLDDWIRLNFNDDCWWGAKIKIKFFENWFSIKHNNTVCNMKLI